MIRWLLDVFTPVSPRPRRMRHHRSCRGCLQTPEAERGGGRVTREVPGASTVDPSEGLRSRCAQGVDSSAWHPNTGAPPYDWRAASDDALLVDL